MFQIFLRYVQIYFFVFLLFSLKIFSNEFTSGLLFEPYELYSTVPMVQPIGYPSRRGLPPKVDLRDFFPPAGFQGKQGSCVAFATSYAVQSYYEFQNRKKLFQDWNSLKIGNSINPKVVFSPAFVYNSLNKGKDNGITYFEALSFLVHYGSVPWEYMPYSPQNFTQKPDPKLYEIAKQYSIQEFKRVRFQNLEELKTFLANKEPILTGVIIYSNLHDLKANEIYSSHSGKPLGGHAIVLVGYDDEKKAFLFLNSWGTNWADGGYGWIDYNWFLKTARVGYIISKEKPNLVSSRGDLAGNIPISIDTKSIEFPREIFATQGSYSDKVVLTWEKSFNALGYEIYRSFAHEENFSKIGVSTTTTFVDDGVIPELAYSYKIIALGENQKSNFSEQKVIGFASKSAKNIPAKVMGLRVSKDPNKIRLDWENIEYGVTGYQVYKWDIKTNTFKPIAKVQANWYEDKSPNKNGVETYIVAALNKNITGVPSNSVVGKIETTLKLESPKDFQATQGIFSDKIILTWKKIPNVKEYHIYIYKDHSWEFLDSVTKEEYVHFTKERVKNIYVVQAVGLNGNLGEFSEPKIGYVDPKVTRGLVRLASPSFLEISVNYDVVYLNWDRVEGSKTYNIWLKRIGESNWTFWGNVNGETKTSFMLNLPEKDIIYLFAVTSSGDEFLESDYSPIKSAAYSIAKKSVQPRAFPSSSKLEKITGTWTGMYWDSFTAKNLVMKIDSLDNSTIRIILDGKKNYEARFIPSVDEIEIEGKLKIRLDNLRALVVEVKDKSIFNENVEIAFLRE